MCARILVSGKVQGVFFRASCAAQARALHIAGYARNLPDGRVEVEACGARADVDRLIAWLHTGPAAARVTGVDAAPAACREETDFVTG